MKTYRILTLILLLSANQTLANNTYIEDVRSFGYVAGEGLACGAERYPTYELIARAFLVSSAKSDEEQAKGMFEYNSAKAEAYLSKKQDGLFACNEVNSRFNRQKIFKSKLYKNGTLKLPDGKVIKPRQKYNPNYLYDRKTDERAKLNAYYDNIIKKRAQKAKKEGIYQKIRQEEAKR